jgi:hypothetical protein
MVPKVTQKIFQSMSLSHHETSTPGPSFNKGTRLLA